MSVTAKVVVEIQFSRERMPKTFLEGILKDLGRKREEFVKPFRLTDPDVKCRIYYEDFTVPQVSVRDLIPRPDLMGVLRRGKARIFKPSEQNNGIDSKKEGDNSHLQSKDEAIRGD
jgi:hypothetical protein